MTTKTNALGGFTNVYDGPTPRPLTNDYPNLQTTVYSYFGTNDDNRLDQIQHLGPSASVISKFAYTYNAEGQIKTWTQQTNAGPVNAYTFGYDLADQLRLAIFTIDGVTNRNCAYTYDAAGNRTGEEIDENPVMASHNDLNQVTAIGAGGPMRFAGTLSETGLVTVDGVAATMTGTNIFEGRASTVVGTNFVSLSATDVAGNSTNVTYSILVSSNNNARTLSYDLNGNLETDTGPTTTNLYSWDGANRLVKITQYLDDGSVRESDFEYDGLGRRVRQTELTNGVEESQITLVWCGLQLCEERDADGENVTGRFFANGEQISGTNYFYLREYLDHVFYWNANDLQRKLDEFKTYFNASRVHSGIDGKTPDHQAELAEPKTVSLDNYTWKSHCNGLFQMPCAA